MQNKPRTPPGRVDDDQATGQGTDRPARVICPSRTGGSHDIEHQQYAEFASARWRALVRSGVLLGCDLHTAEDLAQATLLRCYVKWAQVERATDRDAYVARVLINLHRQSRRRRWWQERPTSELPETATHDRDVDGTETVRAALEHLSQAHREVVLLRIHLQLPEREAAAVLGIAPGTVKSRLSRALARLSTDPSLIDLHRGGEA